MLVTAKQYPIKLASKQCVNRTNLERAQCASKMRNRNVWAVASCPWGPRGNGPPTYL